MSLSGMDNPQVRRILKDPNPCIFVSLRFLRKQRPSRVREAREAQAT